MENKLYVGNLDFQTTSDDLRDLFAGAGNVLSARVIADRDSGRSKGFAFVEMATDADAAKAISLYNGFTLYGRAMLVSQARPREEQPSRDNFGRGINSNPQARFREIKHKRRGGANRRRY